MAAKGISSVQPKNSHGFMMLLSYAVCEWFLIFMLFIDAGLSYLLTKFAQYCDLQTPCPLCSRIDHVFEKRNPGHYRSLLCSEHREEISCLVKCNNHDKLVDVHAMCEDCITSIIKSIKSSSESYRLMLEKIGPDINESGLKIGETTCSCCSKILRATRKAERFIQLTPVGFGASKADVKPPLPRMPGRSRFSRRNSLKRLRDKIAGPNSPRSAISTGVDKLSHVGYTELKLTSESESEVPMSDDGYSTSASCRKGNQKAESYRRKGSQKPPKEVNYESGPTKQMNQSCEHLPSLVDLSVFPESIERNDTNALTPGASIHHGLGEIDWHYRIANPTTSSALPELISMDDALKDSTLTVESDTLIKHQPNVSILPELDQLNHGIPEISVDLSGNINSRNVLLAKTTETGNLENENHAQSNHGNSFEKLISVSPGRDPSTSETIHGIHVDQDELPRSGSGSVSSDAIEMIQMAAELRMHDNGHDTLDSIGVKEIEGESVVERLKRQVDYDRMCLKALYKELEEERNAAAIAANQAMAMITRLQEEKASLHMEALQYLRMMEEQAEYDMEALEKANELLAEREKEIKDLEAELEIDRFSYLDEPTADGSRNEASNITNQQDQTNHVEIGPSLNIDLNSGKSLTINHKANSLNNTASDFESEKIYVAQCLQLLEKKLHQLYCQKQLVSDDEKLINHENGNNSFSIQKETSPSNPSHVPNSTDLVMENHFEDKTQIDDDMHNFSGQAIDVKIDSFQRAITDLQDRLQTLEVDSNILKLALNSLQNGNEGLQFIQEISHQLQELRNIEFALPP